MRILHTSDWHLGLNLGHASRAPDHERFLEWLLGALAEHRVDALVVAGDVFDVQQPSAEALGMYYRFLARVGGTGVRDVVVVAGNHDSPSKLDAPGEVLEALSVHVVGGIRADDASWERCLVPLHDRSGEPGAVCLAVPYVHEYRLGVRTSDLDRVGVRNAFAAAFQHLYRTLCDRAEARWGGLPLVATGHLTLGTSLPGDFPQPIHRVGQIDALPDSVLDPRIRYAALGHIHRPMSVVPGRVCYSGSPVACSLAEAETPRQVLLVDVPPGGREVAVRPLMVPVARQLIELCAPADELIEQLQDLTWTEDLPPLLYLRPRLGEHDPALRNRIFQALGRHPSGRRPGVVEIRPIFPEAAYGAPGGDADRPLAQRSPVEVFRLLCRTRKEPVDPEPLVAAFHELLGLTEADLALRCMEIDARGAGGAPDCTVADTPAEGTP